MAAPTARSTEILTEHLGFPPIALIDDIINAVNGVMYKCTQAVETYLVQKTQREDDEVVMAHDVGKSEIEMGTAKLETLLENAVDKNFDKFELYALRNVLTIPNELSEGWLLLRHYEGVDLDKKAEAKSVELDLKINSLYKEITTQLLIKKELHKQLRKAGRIVKLLTIYRDSILFLGEQPQGLNQEIKSVLESLQPLDQTLYYLVSQTTELFDSVDKMSVFNAPTEDERDKYLNVEAVKLLQVLGLTDNKAKMEKLLGQLDNVDLENEEMKMQLREKFGL